MAICVFSIPARGCPESSSEMNAFLRSQKIVSIERILVNVESTPFWTFCVEYLDSVKSVQQGSPSAASRSGKSRVDYREILSDNQFALFSKLRDLRKKLSEEEAVPVYAIFTNEQLAAIVRQNIQNKSELRGIDGIGESRVEKYGQRILDCLFENAATPPAEADISE